MRFIALILVFFAATAGANGLTFNQAKTQLKNQVYYDTMDDGTFYCGCKWEWKGATGGRVDLASCGYQVRKNQVRAERTEWEHVVTAWVLGHQRQCWKNGGRKNCIDTDPTFRLMEGDPHNLHIAIGEVNGDRSNFSFGMLPSEEYKHGACDFKVDFKQKVVEPRNEVKGQIARIYFYMHDHYNLNMSRQQQQLFMAWNKQYPVTQGEIERDKRIKAVVGHSNPFVTGERQWELGRTPKKTGQGSTANTVATSPLDKGKKPHSGKIKGNKNSKIFHAPGCGSYDKVSPANTVYFNTESEATSQGYRKAKNCP